MLSGWVLNSQLVLYRTSTLLVASLLPHVGKGLESPLFVRFTTFFEVGRKKALFKVVCEEKDVLSHIFVVGIGREREEEEEEEEEGTDRQSHLATCA